MDDCHQKSSTSQLHFYKLDVLFQGSHDGVIVVTYVVFLNCLVFRYICNCMALLIVALIAACVEYIAIAREWVSVGVVFSLPIDLATIIS